MEFDPNGVGVANGNIFGFPVYESDANIVIIPVPWDATASYGKGTSDGPKVILEASTQLDFFHSQLTDAHLTKVFMTPISQEWKKINDELCIESIDYISFLENGGDLSESKSHQATVEKINEAQNALSNQLLDRALNLINSDKVVGVLGGEHSTPFGLIKALNEKYTDFGILQIDAHADLRNAYEGFVQSHASIMFNVLNHCTNMSKLVQVGIRDIAQSEVHLIKNSDNRIQCFFDWAIKEGQFNGKSWATQVTEIINELPQNVYISFDIDGLSPELCPNTGTPVPGGFKLEEINFLLFELAKSGKRIIGFDLNEVAPGNNGDWDANVGARALWNLICAVQLNQNLLST
jgi:agmatinase